MSSQPDSAEATVAITVRDFLWFVDLALDEMVSIVRLLGDEDANGRPDLQGANSPFAILTHCLGVMEFWGGAVVAGRTIQRDRDAEFRAHGSVQDLADAAATARRQLEGDISRFDSMAPLPDGLGPRDAEVPYGRAKGAVLVHILEELLQHLGQMEISRDVLLSGG